MPSAIIEEFIQALDQEIDAIKRGKGGSILKIFNGRFLREVSGVFVYIFNLENFLAILEDSPAEIRIGGNTYQAQVLLTQGLEVEIGIERSCGQFIAEAWLQTNLWYLLDLLKKKFAECESGSGKIDFRLSETLFSSSKAESNASTGNRSEMLCAYPTEPPNEAQKQAIECSITSQLSVIWGPPGTGKTRTIAQAIGEHLHAGRRVLLVSHANNAVDEALEQVAEHLKDSPLYQEGKLVRLGKPQEEHLIKLGKGYELVLLDKIAARLGESLCKEKKELEVEKSHIDELLAQFEDALTSRENVKRLLSELEGLKTSIPESHRKLRSVRDEMIAFEQSQITNRGRLKEAQTAGTLKRIFKRLDTGKIQRDIDLATVSIDAKKRIIGELTNRLDELKKAYSKRNNDIISAKGQAEALLNRLGITDETLENKRKDFSKRKDTVLSRIAEIKRYLEELQKKILSEARLVATTLTKTFVAKQFPDIPFDVLVLDEASMAPLPHLYWAASRCRQSVTIDGDFLQLPPICIAEGPMAQKWLGRSIFAVLGIDTVQTACRDRRVKLLDIQYRMPPEISVIPNTFFYQNKLKDDPSTYQRPLNDGVSDFPLVLIETSEINPWCSRLSTGGRFNLYNALVCATLAKRIVKKVSDSRIGIVTPYNAQARLINKIAKDWELLEHVRISTVHRFQGGQAPIIIFDSVEGPGTRVAPMLDDTKGDSDARLVLNVALTRSQNRLYFVGHSKHLLHDLHPDSTLARLIHHLYENAEKVDSETLVDGYFATDFEKWADILLATAPSGREPVSGELHTEKNFWAQFLQDIKTVKERLIILSPFLTVRRSSVLMDYFRAMVGRAIEVRVYTRPKNQQRGEMESQADIVIEQLQAIGVKVIERPSMHQKVAILDKSIAWEGSLNILSHRDSGEQMRRFEGQWTIEEIIRNLDLEDDKAAGNQTEEKCPKLPCDGYLVVRNRFGRKFLGCSNYPKTKCSYTRPLDHQRPRSGEKPHQRRNQS